MARDRVLVDPTHDFGKNTFHGLALLRHVKDLVNTGWPVLMALSNKDFVGETLGVELTERLEGTLAATALAAAAGARGCSGCTKSAPPDGCWKWWRRSRAAPADAHGEGTRMTASELVDLAAEGAWPPCPATSGWPTAAGPVRIGRSSELEAAKAGRTISVVLPALNEEDTVESVIDSISPLVGGLVDELIVLDSGSTDDTEIRAIAAGARVDQPGTGPARGRAAARQRRGAVALAGRHQRRHRGVRRLRSDRPAPDVRATAARAAAHRATAFTWSRASTGGR